MFIFGERLIHDDSRLFTILGKPWVIDFDNFGEQGTANPFQAKENAVRLTTCILSLLVPITLMTACSGGKGGLRGDELDPDTAAEVRRVNLERYGGDWLITGTKGSVYLSIHEEGFYWVEQDKEEKALGVDFGRIDHKLPGKMILYSDRSECETSRIGTWLWMDRIGDTVRMVNSDNKNEYVNLTAVERREIARSLPCTKLTGTD